MSAHGEDLDALQIEHASLANRCRTLVTAFSNYQFKNAKARFYARSVIPWRLHILMRCTDSVFGKLPLEWTKFPNVDALADARIAVTTVLHSSPLISAKSPQPKFMTNRGTSA
jgi:hypothetical protein